MWTAGNKLSGKLKEMSQLLEQSGSGTQPSNKKTQDTKSPQIVSSIEVASKWVFWKVRKYIKEFQRLSPALGSWEFYNGFIYLFWFAIAEKPEWNFKSKLKELNVENKLIRSLISAWSPLKIPVLKWISLDTSKDYITLVLKYSVLLWETEALKWFREIQA